MRFKQDFSQNDGSETDKTSLSDANTLFSFSLPPLPVTEAAKKVRFQVLKNTRKRTSANKGECPLTVRGIIVSMKIGLESRMIGVLAMQGGYDAHFKTLTEKMGLPARLVRTSEELDSVDALILPGGESTTIIKLLKRIALDEEIVRRAKRGMPIFGHARE